MITTSFTSILDESNNVVGKRLTVYYNGKVVNTLDYPPTAEMTQDDLDNYIAAKLSGLLS